MLKERYVNDKLSSVLTPQKDYKPYPKIEDRAAWESLPEQVRDKLIREGEKYLGFEWPATPLVRFLDFQRNGNRSRYERLYFLRRHALAHLLMAECVEDQSRFLDDIANGIWCICEESTWVVPAHIVQLPDVEDHIIDLFSSETANLLAWTYYLIKSRLDRVSTRIAERIRLETRKRIFEPYLKRNDFWWMGIIKDENHHVNNWNPWINSNCLAAFLLMEEDESRRTEAVAKIMTTLDHFLDMYHDDGGCDEGPGYWVRAGASLFDCLELLYDVSGGEIDIYHETKIQNIGRYIYRVYIDDDYFINFADGGARMKIDPFLVYRFGRRIGDEYLTSLAAAFYQREREQSLDQIAHFSPLRVLPALQIFEELDEFQGGLPYVRDVWMDGIQVMVAREKEGTAEGLYLATKGGHNNESHNHNDVGNFIVFSDGKPVFIDVGVETYTAKTFSKDRYDIWTMQSAFHNLPTVNGIMQHAGEAYRAAKVKYSSNDEMAEVSLDIASAYPGEAGIRSWIRTCRMIRGPKARIEVIDDFQLEDASDDVLLTLMTPCEPYVGSGEISLPPQDACHVTMEFDDDILSASYERIEIQDSRLLQSWGDHIYRILLKLKDPVKEGRIVIRITQS